MPAIISLDTEELEAALRPNFILRPTGFIELMRLFDDSVVHLRFGFGFRLGSRLGLR